jgi:hypothetical protein
MRNAPEIRTPDQRLRVFVSSTLGELAAERTRAALTKDEFEEEFGAGRQTSPDEATEAGLAAETRAVS